MDSVNSWNISNQELHQFFQKDKDLLFFKVRGNFWEPLSRWLKLDSRLFRETTIKARITVSDLQSLGQIYNYNTVAWNAKKITPLNTKNLPSFLVNSVRKLPLIRSIAYEIELVLYKYSANTDKEPVSIVIPARNEEGNKALIKEGLEKLKSLPKNTEIIFVEGNSKDKTWEILESIKEEFKDDFLIHLVKQTSKGKKDAVIEGFKYSNCNLLAIIDSDFTVDIDDSVGAIYQAMQCKDVFINCSRTIFPMEKDAMRWANYIGNRFFAVLLSLLINQSVSDSLCGTKVFSRKLYNAMKLNGSWDSKADPFGDFTLLFQAAKNNNKILNYPVSYYARKAGAPNISRWVDGLKLLKVSFLYFIS